MPELPEVETTVLGLKKHVVGRTITDVWSDYNSAYFKGADNIKDPEYFRGFKKKILGHKVNSVERRAKNILINITGGQTLLVHMKMTGHLLYGTYDFKKSGAKTTWIPVEPESLKDPFNRHLHFVITFDNGKRLALSDARKFAKVTVLNTHDAHDSIHLGHIGPEPLAKSFDLPAFNARIDKRPYGNIKLVLMDQTIIAGIGNIYADESLWRAGIHPLERVSDVKPAKRAVLFKAIKETLKKGIDLGGDSMSDYRNILGEKGKFQERHSVYQKRGEKCGKVGCKGTIIRIVVGGRGTHLCDKHQKLSGK